MIKTVIFDLGGVLFGRNPELVTGEMKEFFNFLTLDPVPDYWNEYDRGTQNFEETAEKLAEIKSLSVDYCKDMIRKCISILSEIKPTARMIEELSSKGFKLYVLSNMSFDYIEHLRTKPVYGCFDGEVISCQYNVIKPEPAIYDEVIRKFDINPSEALFIDDKGKNIATGKSVGLHTYQFDRYRAEECCNDIRAILGV